MKRIFIGLSLLLLFIAATFGQIPAGYYDPAAGLTGENLRAALKTITKTGHVKLSYTPGVWNAYAYTDVRPAPNNTIIWDMYSDVPGGTPPTLSPSILNNAEQLALKVIAIHANIRCLIRGGEVLMTQLTLNSLTFIIYSLPIK